MCYHPHYSRPTQLSNAGHATGALPHTHSFSLSLSFSHLLPPPGCLSLLPHLLCCPPHLLSCPLPRRPDVLLFVPPASQPLLSNPPPNLCTLRSLTAVKLSVKTIRSNRLNIKPVYILSRMSLLYHKTILLVISN